MRYVKIVEILGKELFQVLSRHSVGVRANSHLFVPGEEAIVVKMSLLGKILPAPDYVIFKHILDFGFRNLHLSRSLHLCHDRAFLHLVLLLLFPVFGLYAKSRG